MNTKNLILAGIILVAVSCKKNTSDDESVDFKVLEKAILNDFTHVVALPNYLDLKIKAVDLKDAILNLNNQPTDSNLTVARNVWKNLREPWEQSESWLFGPVEDLNFDPEIDSWPVNRVDLDSLLAGSAVLDLPAIQGFQSTLKGFHSLEYLIFGTDGNKTAAQLTTREREYMTGLSLHLEDVAAQIYNRWDFTQPDNYSSEVIHAGAGSQVFLTRRDAFITIISAMAGICDEVANGKMEEPLVAQDSTLEESQFAKNSVVDFRNNLIGVEHVYFGKYKTDGMGMNEWVASKNLALDNKIQQQIAIALASFNNITLPYSLAIYSQQIQILNCQHAINDLKTTLENELLPFIQAQMTE